MSLLPRMMNIWVMLVSLLLLSACAVYRSAPVVVVALLGPFEGRYREIGYDALYAARLALADSDRLDVLLLPVDDGGTAQSAADRARALALDWRVKVVVTVGYAAAGGQVQQALGDLPVMVAGFWGVVPSREGVFVLAGDTLADAGGALSGISVTQAALLPAPVTGIEVFALAQFSKLRGALDGVTVVSNAVLPDAGFSLRYQSDQFAPQPGLLSTLYYDAFRIAIGAAAESRGGGAQNLDRTNYSGLNGPIRFENGYWASAPLRYYRYDSGGVLIPITTS